MQRRNLSAAILSGLAALSLPTAAFGAFRSYPATYCAQLDSTAYTNANNQLTLDYGVSGRGAVTWHGGLSSSQSIMCPIFNDDALNVRTHTPIHTYVSSSAAQGGNVTAETCVTWAAGHGGRCGTPNSSAGTGLFEILDEGSYTGTYSTSPNDTFFILVRLSGQSAELVSYYFSY